MIANMTDQFTYVALGTKTEMASPGHTEGSTSPLSVNDLTAWPPDSAVFFGMDIVDATGKRIDGTYSEWKGIVAGGVIGSIDLINGTDQDYPAGSNTRVYMLITTAWANSMVDGLREEHNADGTHSDITAASATIAGALSADDGDFAGGVTIADSLTVAGQSISPLPSGVLMGFAGSSVPDGWLLCDGSAVSRTTYAALFTAIGTSYGTGNGTTTFNLPNGKGRSMFGVDSGQTEFSALGTTGGQKTVQQHNHGVSDPGHHHSLWSIGQESNVYSLGGTSSRAVLIGGSPNLGNGITGDSGTGISIQNTGSGSNNLNPYFTGSWIIKT